MVPGMRDTQSSGNQGPAIAKREERRGGGGASQRQQPTVLKVNSAKYANVACGPQHRPPKEDLVYPAPLGQRRTTTQHSLQYLRSTGKRKPRVARNIVPVGIEASMLEEPSSGSKTTTYSAPSPSTSSGSSSYTGSQHQCRQRGERRGVPSFCVKRTCWSGARTVADYTILVRPTKHRQADALCTTFKIRVTADVGVIYCRATQHSITSSFYSVDVLEPLP